MKHSINEIKNTIDKINRLQETEEYISDLEDRVMEINQAEQMRDKYCITRIDLENSVTPSNIRTIAL